MNGMTEGELVERLGQAQQRVMSLTVQVRELKKRAKAAHGADQMARFCDMLEADFARRQAEVAA